jgi:alpha-L-arabinofuranosidase
LVYPGPDAEKSHKPANNKHGFPEPYKIKYRSLGNEMDVKWQMGLLNAEDYSKKALEAERLNKK